MLAVQSSANIMFWKRLSLALDSKNLANSSYHTKTFTLHAKRSKIAINFKLLLTCGIVLLRVLNL